MDVVLVVAGVAVLVLAGLFVGGTIWGIGRSSGWGKGGKRELQAARQQRSLPRAYLNVEGNLKQEDVRKVVAAYQGDGALGSYAQNILDSFERADLRRRGIFSMLEQEFEKTSLTWEKFRAPVEVALSSIVRNAAEEANRMLGFDSAEYQRMDRIERAGGYDDQSAEVARLKVMRASLSEMDALQKKNDHLLLELERLQGELARLTGSGNNTSQAIEEIQQLTEDTHYYS